MPIANLKHGEKELYSQRFQAFLSRIAHAAKVNRRNAHRHPVREAVPFRDIEAALDITLIERTGRKANDNRMK